MATAPDKKKPKKPEVRKRELKSAKRKEGVPVLKKKAKRSKKWWWIGGVFFAAFITAALLVPRMGTIRYGICKTYIELHDPYPESLEFMQASEEGNLVIIDYNRTDSFGQRTLNQLRCVFDPAPNSVALMRVDWNGKAKSPIEDPAEVKKFNKGIPALLQTKPDLTMPRGLEEDVKDYR